MTNVISIHHRFDREIDVTLNLPDPPTQMIHVPLTPPLGLPVVGEDTFAELVAQGGQHRPSQASRFADRGVWVIALLALLALPFGWYGGQIIAHVIRTEIMIPAPTVPGPSEVYKASLTYQQNFVCQYPTWAGTCTPRIYTDEALRLANL